jgi:hypothetical protein
MKIPIVELRAASSKNCDIHAILWRLGVPVLPLSYNTYDHSWRLQMESPLVENDNLLSRSL